MFSIQQPLLVFSDLDSTLLDSHSYDWQPAAPWLSRLHEANIPVILCSSKTSAEMLYLQKMLGLQGLPLIAENGAVIQLAEQWQDIDGFPRIISGISHGEICQVLNTLREKEHFKFTTFDDVDDATIAEWTGLSRSQAALTQLHEASVTLIWRDSDERMAQFIARLNDWACSLCRVRASGTYWMPLPEKIRLPTGLPRPINNCQADAQPHLAWAMGQTMRLYWR